jgi:DNA polymerase-3 subunit gamma/tau
MSYLALYRKYRSQTFDEVMGQRHVTQTLKNALRTGKVAHAYLFCGPRGTGKTTTARLIAKALNCDAAPTDNPCNKCEPCIRITEGRSMDVIEIDAASNRGIDDIKELREQVRYAPTQERYKCYIIDEVHQLSADAFNALLKTLEEPPPHVYFILATTEAHRVPKTIVSRCQRFDFRTATVQDLMQNLRRVASAEGIKISEEALWVIARAANGGWRDSLSLLEQVAAYSSDEEISAQEVNAILGSVELPALFALADAVASRNPGEVFLTIDRLVSEGKEPRRLLTALGGHFRDLMLTIAAYEHAVERFGPELAAQYREQAQKVPPKFLLHAAETLQTAESQLKWSADHRLLLELTLLKLAYEVDGRGQEQQTAPPAVRTQQEAPSAKPAASRAETRPPVEQTKALEKPPQTAARPQQRISLEAVLARWHEVRELVRQNSKSLYPLLERTRPLAVDGQMLKIGATKSALNLLNREQNRKQLEDVVRNLFGVPLGLRFVEAEIGSAQPFEEGFEEEAAAGALVPPPETEPDIPAPWDMPDLPETEAEPQPGPEETDPELAQLAKLFDGDIVFEEREKKNG